MVDDRNRRLAGYSLLFAAAMIGSFWVGTLSRSAAPNERRALPRATEAPCVVELYPDMGDMVTFELRREGEVQRLIREPLQSAKPVPPMEYKVMGVIRVADKDGGKEIISLFVPWGTFERAGKYQYADLSGLRKHLAERANGIVTDFEKLSR